MVEPKVLKSVIYAPRSLPTVSIVQAFEYLALGSKKFHNRTDPKLFTTYSALHFYCSCSTLERILHQLDNTCSYKITFLAGPPQSTIKTNLFWCFFGVFWCELTSSSDQTTNLRILFSPIFTTIFSQFEQLKKKTNLLLVQKSGFAQFAS